MNKYKYPTTSDSVHLSKDNIFTLCNMRITTEFTEIKEKYIPDSLCWFCESEETIAYLRNN